MSIEQMARLMCVPAILSLFLLAAHASSGTRSNDAPMIRASVR